MERRLRDMRSKASRFHLFFYGLESGEKKAKEFLITRAKNILQFLRRSVEEIAGNLGSRFDKASFPIILGDHRGGGDYE